MCDCELPSVFNQTKPKARKRYKCCECHGFIEIGQRYEYSWGIWEGSASSYKTCLECSRLRNEVGKLTGCCVPFTGIWEEICELDDNDKERSRFNDIRIMRSADICQVHRAEENEIKEFWEV